MKKTTWKTLSESELEQACGGMVGSLGDKNDAPDVGDIQQNPDGERPYPDRV